MVIEPAGTRMRRVANKRVRILIADREGVFRLGLKKLFALEDDLRVVAQAENAGQVAGLAEKFNPDIYFIQSDIADEDSGALLRQLRPTLELVTSGCADEGRRRADHSRPRGGRDHRGGSTRRAARRRG